MQRGILLRLVLKTYSSSSQTDREQLTKVLYLNFTFRSLQRLLLELISQPCFMWLFKEKKLRMSYY